MRQSFKSSNYFWTPSYFFCSRPKPPPPLPPPFSFNPHHHLALAIRVQKTVMFPTKCEFPFSTKSWCRSGIRAVFCAPIRFAWFCPSFSCSSSSFLSSFQPSSPLLHSCRAVLNAWATTLSVRAIGRAYRNCVVHIGRAVMHASNSSLRATTYVMWQTYTPEWFPE